MVNDWSLERRLTFEVSVEVLVTAKRQQLDDVIRLGNFVGKQR